MFLFERQFENETVMCGSSINLNIQADAGKRNNNKCKDFY